MQNAHSQLLTTKQKILDTLSIWKGINSDDFSNNLGGKAIALCQNTNVFQNYFYDLAIVIGIQEDRVSYAFKLDVPFVFNSAF